MVFKDMTEVNCGTLSGHGVNRGQQRKLSKKTNTKISFINSINSTWKKFVYRYLILNVLYLSLNIGRI